MINRNALLTCLSFILLYFISFGALSNEVLGIEVTGEGKVMTTPDNFSLSVTITERGRLTTKIKALVDKKSNNVILAAKRLGIKEQQITSARVNLRVINEKPSITVQGIEVNKFAQNAQQKPIKNSIYVDGKELTSHKNKSTLFELSRQITVVFNSIDDYDRFLNDLVKIQVSHISSLSMSVAESEQYYQQALEKAIIHAKTKAEKIASRAGVSLGNLVYLKELSSNHYQPRYSMSMMASDRGPQHSSLVSSKPITASIVVKFAIVD